MKTTEPLDRREIERVLRIKRAAEAELLRRPDVFGVDVGYKYVASGRTDTIAVRVHVAGKRDVPPEDAIPPTLDGVPTDVLHGRMGPQPGGMRAALPMADQRRYDPLIGGISAARCTGDARLAGTLGCIVVNLGDRGTSEWGTPMLLGSAQTMASNEGRGEIQAQPSPYDCDREPGWSCDGEQVGRLSRSFLGDGPAGVGVDAAVARQTDRGFDWTIAGLWETVAGTAPAALGTAVRKRGRTTGISHGVITGIDATYVVRYPDGKEVTLRRQLTVSADPAVSERFMDAGDAGAVVVDHGMSVVGVLWGFNNDATPALAGASPIAAVESALGVQVPYTASDPWIRQPARPSDMRSTQGPTLAVMAGNLLGLAWTGTDQRLNIATSDDGKSFGNVRTYDHLESNSAPWLACGATATYVVITDIKGMVQLVRFDDWLDSNAHEIQPMMEISAHGPSLVALGERSPGIDELVLTWTATDGVIWARYGDWTDGIGKNRRALPDSSRDGPYLTAPKNARRAVGVSFQDPNRELYFRYSTDPASLRFPTRVHVQHEHTAARPASLPLPGGHYSASGWIAWSGTDAHRYLNLEQCHPTPGRKVTYPFETCAAPALVTWNERPWIAWTDHKRQVHVAQVA